MLTERINRSLMLIGIIALLAMPWAFVGCGDDDNRSSEDVSARNTTPSRTTSTPVQTIPQTPQTAPVAQETVVALEEEPREVTYEEAEAAFLEKDYDRAVELFAVYTEHKTENPWGFYMLGLSAWKAEAYESAETAFERAIELDPRHVKSHVNLSRVFLDINRPGKALITINDALEIDPESSVAHRLQGVALHRMGKREEAVGAYRRAIELDNQDAWAMNNLGLVLIEQEQFDDALRPLARAVELKGDVAVFQNNLGMALERTGRFRAAEAAYQAAVAVDEAYEKAAANLFRIADVVQDPETEDIDLAQVALDFVAEIESWSETVVATDLPEAIEPQANEIAAGDADSTGTGQDR